MGKFSKKVPAVKTQNLAGGFAYKLDHKTELVSAVLTTFLDDKFYEKGTDRQARIIDLVTKVPAQFVANLAIVARTEFNMRSVSTLLLGEIAKTHKGDSLVKDTIVRAGTRVDDLTELVAYVGSPLPKQVKRGVRNALLKFNRYQLAKYKGEGNEVSLVDVFNMVHPKVQHANEEQAKAWEDLMKGELKSFDTWETEISNSKEEERKGIWEKLVSTDKLGYMALLRNLNNLLKHKVSEETIDKVVAKLTDREEVKRSKQLPFRFTTAYENVSGNRKLSNAISDAMDAAVDNCPEFTGRTLIAIDSSGSMGGNAIEKASIFGATLFKRHPNADLIMYDTSIKELNLTDRMSVIALSTLLKNNLMGGGTNTSLVFEYATKKGVYDRIIVVSDNESWQDSNSWQSTTGTQAAYNEYKKTTADPFVFLMDVQGYGTKDVNSEKVSYIAGWSDRILDFMSMKEKDGGLVKYIESFK
jgi:hypothetical protein